MQGKGRLGIPGLGPCIGVMVYDTAQKLAVGGHFPVARSNDWPSSKTLLPEMLDHVAMQIPTISTPVWIGGGVLRPKFPSHYGKIAAERLERIEETEQHRKWVKDTVVKHLGAIPVKLDFGAPPTNCMYYSIDVATGKSNVRKER